MTTRRLFSSAPCLLAGATLITSACNVRFDDGTDSLTGMLADAGDTSSSAPASTAAETNQTSTNETRSTSTTSSNPTTSASSNSSSTRAPTSAETSSDEPESNDSGDETSNDDETSTEPTDTGTSDGDTTSSGSTTDASSSESTTDTSDDGPVSDEVPMTDHCAAAADWDPEWSQWEEEVLELVNEYRAEGADCGEEGVFDPAGPLEMDPVLRCSARLHSLDMFDRMFFDHTNPDGLDPFDRMDEAGFSGSYMGENIAMGQTDPVEVMQAWIDSDGHCSNVMSPNYTLIGVGYYPGSPNDFRARNYWTQNFGTPQQFGAGMGGGAGGRGN